MLKGCCEIILSENGKEIKRTKDYNIVTDALAEMFSFPHKYWLPSTNIKDHYASLTPLATSGTIGGVVLLKNPIEGTDEELKKKTQLPIGKVNITGHAGDNTDYNPKDLTRGVYNPTESHEVENGFQYVWDFSTETGNGDISCVCLTTNAGGEGIPVDRYSIGNDVDYVFKNPGDIGHSTQTYDLIVWGITKGGELAFSYRDLNEKINIYTVNLDASIGLFDKISGANFGGTLAKDSSATIHELPFSTTYKHLQWTDRGLAYLDGQSLYIVDTEDWQIKESYSFGVSFLGNRAFFVKDNYFYGLSSDRKSMYKINLLDNTDLTIQEMPAWNESSISPIYISDFCGEFGELMAMRTNFTGGYRMLFYDGFNTPCLAYSARAGLFSSADKIVNFAKINNQYSVFSHIPSSSNYGYLAFAQYFAPAITIDNLETPVTKTNAQTMKVIYTITQEPDETESEE